MIGKVLAAIIGSKIDQRDGSGGVKGAILGATAAGVIRRMGPLGIVLGGAYLAKKAYDKRRTERVVTPAE
ncbi:hypothetical protein [Sphingomonas sp. ID0503]|uniref:hypothetical protein n=1 Tax=Sphingomonas sp. ID0503 TaxID=3399691 RepID=UPI003AFA398D